MHREGTCIGHVELPRHAPNRAFSPEGRTESKALSGRQEPKAESKQKSKERTIMEVKHEGDRSRDSGAGVYGTDFENCCISGAGRERKRVERMLWWPSPTKRKAG